ALSLLLSIYSSNAFAGAISAILVNVPGSSSAMITCIEGYPLAKKGEAGRALGIATVAGTLAGLFSIFAFIIAAPALANVAYQFGPPEYFALMLFGLSMVASISGKGSAKNLISAAFGVLLGTVGVDFVTGAERFTFGYLEMTEGFKVVPILIGMFVVAELMLMIGRNYVVEGSAAGDQRSVAGMRRGFALPFRYPLTLLRSSVVGMIVGIVPAAGGALASFTSYALAKRASRTRETFGKGNPEGIVAAESANNACSGGALMTTMVLGVPGSVATAVLLGAMAMHDLRAGPQLVHQQIPIVYGLIMAAIVSQVFMVAMATGMGYAMTGALAVRTRVLVPILLIFSLPVSYTHLRAHE
uniref:tripartite tricarboxylate transporter permease n=1 Tax=Pantanalinema rosaneae TaxID=1620701 RepID=UPI003D6E5C06